MSCWRLNFIFSITETRINEFVIYELEMQMFLNVNTYYKFKKKSNYICKFYMQFICNYWTSLQLRLKSLSIYSNTSGVCVKNKFFKLWNLCAGKDIFFKSWIRSVLLKDYFKPNNWNWSNQNELLGDRHIFGLYIISLVTSVFSYYLQLRNITCFHVNPVCVIGLTNLLYLNLGS